MLRPIDTPRSPWPVILLSSLVIATGSALAVQSGMSGLRGLPWFWLVTCALAEAGWIRLPDGRSTLSMGSIANFAAVLVLPLEQAIVCATLACLIVESAIMRKPVQRALYNSAGTAITIAVTSAVLHAMPGAGRAGAGGAAMLTALVLAAATYYACNRALVISVVALDRWIAPAQVWRQDFGLRRDTLPSGAAFSLGVLLAHEYQGLGPLTLVLFLIPAALVLEAHRRQVPNVGVDQKSGASEGTQRAA